MKTKRRRLVADEIPNQKPSDSADIQKNHPYQDKKRKERLKLKMLSQKGNAR